MLNPTILTREALEKIINEVLIDDDSVMPFMASGVLAKNATDQTNISYEIRKVRRDIGTFQGHGTPAGTRQLEVIGKNSFEFPHTFESKLIPGALALNLRNPGSDRLQKIATDQVTREQLDNNRHLNRQDEFLYAGALQGKISIKLRNGAQLRSYDIDYGFPADQQLTVGGAELDAAVLDKAWDDPDSPLLQDIDAIIQKVAETYGRIIRRAYTTPEVLTALVSHNKIKGYFQQTPAGQEFIRTGGITDIKGITWYAHRHVYDNAGTPTRYIPKGRVIFTPNPDPSWGEWFDAGAVTVGPSGHSERTIGRYSFAKSQHNPPGEEIFYGSSRGPVIYQPAVIVADVLS
jgi:hypothetical protein